MSERQREWDPAGLPAFERLEPRLLLSAPPIISEFMAVNDDTLADEDGNYPDWIEIHNPSPDEPVDLTGWQLVESRFEWTFPAMTLQPGEYLVVFASDKDRAVAGAELHTNFKLDGDGEYLALLDPAGAAVHAYSPKYPPQLVDISYGFPQQYFITPTPGEANVAGVLGIVATPAVGVPRGFYDEPQSVEITTDTANAEIRYTLDGSAPTATSGTLYDGPIPITATSVLRAAAFRPGYAPSSVATHTYLISEPEAIRSLPVISLVGDEYETFGTEVGLWADVMLRGIEAEFDVSFEVIRPEDNSSIHQDAGIRLHGSSYRRVTIGPNPDAKWSFKVFFREEYDEQGWLNYPLIEYSDVDRYKSVTLRGGYNDATNPFIKDELGRRLFEDLGGTASVGTFVNLFLNGSLKNNGYYNPAERYDENMLQEKLHSDLRWDVVEKWQPSGLAADPPRNHDEPYYFDVRDGDAVSFAEMLDYALANDLSQSVHYEEIAGRLDIPQFVSYLILQGYTNIHDWPQNNWCAARERSDGPLGTWQFLAWDLEFGWGPSDLTADFKTPGGGDLLPINILYTALMANGEFRQLFADRAQAAFLYGGPLSEQNVVARFEVLRGEMAGVLPTMDTYIRDVWAGQRPGYVLDSMLAKGLFTFAGPSFAVNGTASCGGRIAPGDVLTIAAPTGTVYYTLDGSDPRLAGGGVSPGAAVYAGPIPLDHSHQVRARVLDGGVWSALSDAGFHVDISPSLRITEIMYHPADPTDDEIAAGFCEDGDFEYVEITNISDEAIHLGRVRLTDGVYLSFPAMELAPGAYGLAVANRPAFEARYGQGLAIVGEYAGSLANGGETVVLADPLGEEIHRFAYGDWYGPADGEGYSLNIVDPEGPMALWGEPQGWKAGKLPGGTPGADDDGWASGVILIHETLAHSHDEADDWIELLNTTGEDIDIGGWFLSDTAEDLTLCEIPPDTVVPAGQYRVLMEDEFFGVAFALSELGDDLHLSAGYQGQLGGYREHVDFGASPTGTTFGLYVKSTGETDFTLLSAATPGDDNAGPVVASLVINELMYHPALPDPAGGFAESDYEFIELHNASAEPIDLTEYVLSGGVGFTFGWYDADDFATATWTLQAGATATWQTPPLDPGEHEVFAWWDAADGEGDLRRLDSAAAFRIDHPGGPTVVTVDQNRQAGQWVSLGTYDFDGGAGTVTLLRGTDQPEEWTLADRVKFVGPGPEVVIDNAGPGFETAGSDVTSLPAGGYVVITRNADAFDDRYDVAGSGIILAGQYTGRLANDGESIRLLRADRAESTGFIPTVRYDHVAYEDAAPWPAEPDGLGASLCRSLPGAYGNDPATWGAGLDGGTPGAENLVADTTPPSAPAGLAAEITAGGTAVELTWTASADAQSGVDHYLIYRNAVAYDTSPTTAYSDTGVLLASSHSYDVSAVNGDGYESARSDPVTIAIPHTAAGTILLEYWTGIAGGGVSNLTGHPDYPDAPAGRDYPAIFELPADDLGLEDNYGTRMRGYLHPPATGNYVFWIASDNASELWLSTDETVGSAVLIASVPDWTPSRDWDKYPSQQSVEVFLEVGLRYYVEAIQKEGAGGDNLAVGWRLPDSSLERPIPDVRLSPWALGPGVESFQRNDGLDRPGQLASITVRFSEDVSASLDPTDLAVRNDSTGETIDLSGAIVEYTAETDTARWLLSGLPIGPGYYTVRVVADGIDNAAGFALDGDGDGIPGGDREMTLMVALGGDAGLDGTVGELDYLAVKAGLGTASGATWARGDFDGDGNVDRDDLLRLVANFGVSLPPPAPAAQAGAESDVAAIVPAPGPDGQPAPLADGAVSDASTSPIAPSECIELELLLPAPSPTEKHDIETSGPGEVLLVLEAPEKEAYPAPDVDVLDPLALAPRLAVLP